MKPNQRHNQSTDKSRGPAFSVESSIPGRVRLRLTERYSLTDRLGRLAFRIAALDDVSAIDVRADAASLVIAYDCRQTDPQAFLDNLVSSVLPAHGEFAVPNGNHHKITGLSGLSPRSAHPGHHEPLRAKDVPEDAKSGPAAMIVPTAAAVLAAIDLVPVVVVVAVITISAAPVAIRALRNLRKRNFVVEVLDVANVVMTAAQGSLLQSASIAFLVNLSEVMRSAAAGRSKRRHLEARAAASVSHSPHRKTARTVELIENALVNDTDFQILTRRRRAALTAPFVAVAVVLAVATGDVAMIVGILRPLYDYARAMRFGIPMILMNAMTHAARHGPIFSGGRAVEKLAAVDAIVFFTTAGFADNHALKIRVDTLVDRGIHFFALPSDDEAALLLAHLRRRGHSSVAVVSLTKDRGPAIDRLVRNGRTVAAVFEPGEPLDGLEKADIRICTQSPTEGSVPVDILVPHADLRGIGHTIDLARHAMKIAGQGKAIATTSATINLGMAFVPPLAATFISTVATGIQALNTMREVEQPSQEEPRTIPLLEAEIVDDLAGPS